MEEQLYRLIREHHQRVRSRFGCLVSDSHLADDLTQQVFVVVCDKLHKGENVENWGGFLVGVAFNVFREHLRKKSRGGTASLEDVENCVSTEPSPSSGAEREETRQRLWRILSMLDVTDREIVTAVHAFGLSAREVGEQLGIPRRRVLHRLTQALGQMREMAHSEGLAL